MHAWAPTLAACTLWLIIHHPLAQSISNVRPLPCGSLLYYPAGVYDSPTSFVHKTNAARIISPQLKVNLGRHTPIQMNIYTSRVKLRLRLQHTHTITHAATLCVHNHTANWPGGQYDPRSAAYSNTACSQHSPRSLALSPRQREERVRGRAGLARVARCWQLGSCMTQALGLAQACCAYNKGYVWNQGILACGKQRSSTHKHMDTS